MTTCAGCNNIEAHPVTLVSGTIVCGTCPAWFHECEARAIARLPTPADRRAWLGDIEHKRGPQARQALQDTLKALWEAKQR